MGTSAEDLLFRSTWRTAHRNLDFDDYRHHNAKGLTPLARFTGRGITADDLTAIYDADQACVLQH